MLDQFFLRLAKWNYRHRYWVAGGLWLAAILLIVAILAGWIPWDELSTYGYAGIFVICFLNGAAIILGAPAQLVVLAAGEKLSPLPLGVVAGLGTSIGELTSYYLGRSSSALFDSGLQAKLEQFQRGRLIQFLYAHTFLSLFLLSLVPNPVFDLAGIASGVAGVPLRRYLPPVVLGKTARFIVIAFIGAWLAGR